MYYKWIANHPTYNFNGGGDLSFNRGIKRVLDILAAAVGFQVKFTNHIFPLGLTPREGNR